MNFSKLFYRFITLCQTKPRWSLTKISKLVEVKVLNESHNTQCLGSVVPFAILSLCALNLKLFQEARELRFEVKHWMKILRFWLRRIFGNSWRCQIHPVTFYMTRKGRRNFKCNILTKHREFWNKWHFLSAISCRWFCKCYF